MYKNFKEETIFLVTSFYSGVKKLSPAEFFCRLFLQDLATFADCNCFENGDPIANPSGASWQQSGTAGPVSFDTSSGWFSWQF
jgi:hypothetical protein